MALNEMRKNRILIIILTCVVMITGCSALGGLEAKVDFDQFIGPIQVIESLDPNSYYEHGSDMAKVFKQLFEEGADENIYHVEERNSLFSGVYYQQTMNESSTMSYFGKLKNGKPTGYGVLYNMDEMCLEYIGHFKKGKLQGYGMKIEDQVVITYEGDFSKGKMTGDAVIPYTVAEIDDFYETSEDLGEIYEETAQKIGEKINNTDYCLIRVMPRYIGEVKNGNRVGKGTSYYINGNIEYKGEFKNDLFNGQGTLYYEDGSVWYKGKFSRGVFHGQGTLYNRDGSVEFKGKFKRGDYDF